MRDFVGAIRTFALFAAAVLTMVAVGFAQRVSTRRQVKVPQRPVICPQIGVVGQTGKAAVTVKGVRADVEIKSAKTTTADTKLQLFTDNSSKSSLNCEVLLPVQKGSTVAGVNWNTTKALKPTSNNGVALSNGASCYYCQTTTFQNRQPSLLEFYGFDFLHVPNVSVPAGANKQVEVEYKQTLSQTGNRYDYVLPKSEMLGYRIPWGIRATIDSKEPIATVYSPSHPITWSRDKKAGRINVHVKGNATDEPGAFRLSWLKETDGINGTVFGYPPTKNQDGYFLLLIAPGHKIDTSKAQPREVTLVVDRSASTRGKRLTEIQTIADSIIKQLRPKEKFNVVSYNQKISTFSKNPVGNTITQRNSANLYIDNLKAGGGSNIHDALKTALTQPASDGLLPIVLFFTDGVHTAESKKSEADIRKLVAQGNKANRRIYTFGVGVDLNTPLLQGIADTTGGRATFVLPKEDIAAKVGSVVKRLRYPVLTDPRLIVTKPQAAMVYPKRLPDVFAGETLVVLGRYRGTEKIPFTLRGKFLGKKREFRFVFDPKTATTADLFVPRLWAGRRIAELVGNIRASGASLKPKYAVRSQKMHPNLREWTREILKLTAEHGVLTEYTAFLSNGKQFNAYRQSSVIRQLNMNVNNRAVRSRMGYGSVNQDLNTGKLKAQQRTNGRNRYWSAKMNPVSVPNVQQLGNGAYFRYGSIWVDGRLMNNSKIEVPKRTITFGSKDYELLLNQLAKRGEQGALALDGKVLLLRKTGPVLVVPPSRPSRDAAAGKRKR